MNALWLSLQVAVIVVVLSTVIGAMCALAIARGNLPGARLLTTLFLSPLMLPAILTGLALFQVFMLAGIGRPVWGLVVGPHAGRGALRAAHDARGAAELRPPRRGGGRDARRAAVRACSSR